MKKIDISIGLIKLNSSFVCLKRTSQPFENFIEFPGGKKISNETAIECLRREIKEELNIKIDGVAIEIIIRGTVKAGKL